MVRPSLQCLVSAFVTVIALGTGPSDARADMIVDLYIPGVIIHEKSGAGRISGLSERTSYSLHAGAQAGTKTDIRHNPDAGQPAEANVMPVMLTTRLESGRQFRVAVPTKLQNGKKYTPAMPKPYNDPAGKSSGVAAIADGNAPNVTTSTAEVKVKFTATPQPTPADPKRIRYEAFPDDGFMSVLQQGPKPPFGAVATLVLDPIELTADIPGGDPIQPGDILSGTVMLTREDFSVTISGPDGVVAALAEVGSDFPVSPSPSYGLSFQDLPLVWSLNLGFETDRLLTPDILFEANPNYAFFDPVTNQQLSPGGIAGFVESRIVQHLMMSGPNTVTLDQSDLVVVNWSGTATQSKTTAFADFTQAEIGAQAVPEPSSLGLLAVGMVAGAIAYRKSRSSPERSTSAG